MCEKRKCCIFCILQLIPKLPIRYLNTQHTHECTKPFKNFCHLQRLWQLLSSVSFIVHGTSLCYAVRFRILRTYSYIISFAKIILWDQYSLKKSKVRKCKIYELLNTARYLYKFTFQILSSWWLHTTRYWERFNSKHVNVFCCNSTKVFKSYWKALSHKRRIQ